MVAVRVGEGPRVGVKTLVGQGVKVASIVGAMVMLVVSGKGDSFVSVVAVTTGFWAIISRVEVGIVAEAVVTAVGLMGD